MTSAWLHGQKTKFQQQESYICRQEEKNRTQKRHSNFWIGLYGLNWIVAWHECQAWVEELVAFSRNKQAYYQRGLISCPVKDLSLRQQRGRGSHFAALVSKGGASGVAEGQRGKVLAFWA